MTGGTLKNGTSDAETDATAGGTVSKTDLEPSRLQNVCSYFTVLKVPVTLPRPSTQARFEFNTFCLWFPSFLCPTERWNVLSTWRSSSVMSQVLEQQGASKSLLTALRGAEKRPIW